MGYEPDESSIAKLAEMGISKYDAINALKTANGDIPNAIAIYFSDGSTVNNAIVVDDDVSMCEDPPYSKEPETIVGQAPVEIYNDEIGSSSTDDVSAIAYNIIHDEDRFVKSSSKDLGLFLPVRNGHVESYLAFLVNILSEIPAVREAVLKYDYKDLGFSEQWWRGYECTGAAETVMQFEDKQVDTRMLLELQRCFGALSHDHKRAFAMIKCFLKSFPVHLERKLAESDVIGEFLPDVYSLLSTFLCLANRTDYSNLFSTDVENSIGETQKLSVICIEPDEMDEDLYKTLHSLVWSENVEIGSHTMKNISNVITISLDAITHQSQPNPIRVPEILFPQIYGDEFKDLMQRRRDQTLKTYTERESVFQTMSTLSAFQGKKINGFLNSALDFISKDLESRADEPADESVHELLTDLHRVKDQIKNKKTSLNEQASHLKSLRQRADIYNVESIIEESGLQPEPYYLTGAIMNDSTYFVLNKRDMDLIDDKPMWTKVTAFPDQFEMVHGLSFGHVREYIYGATSRLLESSIVLVYTKESSFFSSTDTALENSGVAKFLDKDSSLLVSREVQI